MSRTRIMATARIAGLFFAAACLLTLVSDPGRAGQSLESLFGKQMPMKKVSPIQASLSSGQSVNVPINITGIPLNWRSADLIVEAQTIYVDGTVAENDALGHSSTGVRTFPVGGAAQVVKTLKLNITKIEGSATTYWASFAFAALRKGNTCLFLGVGTNTTIRPGTPYAGVSEWVTQRMGPFKGTQYECENANAPWPEAP